jgi:hypothetical protein
MSGVSPTSIKAFREILASGAYDTHEDKFLACIVQMGPHTRREVAIITRIEYGSVCQPANRLVKQKVLMEWRTKKNPKTGHTAFILELYDEKIMAAVHRQGSRQPDLL